MTHLDNLVFGSLNSPYIDITFDEGLRRIQKDGYERFMLPEECLSAFIEARDLEEYRRIFRDFCNPYWLSLAFRVSDETLEIARNPVGMVWKHPHQEGYFLEEKELRCSERKSFSLTTNLFVRNKNLRTSIHRPTELSEEALRFIFGENYESLLKSTREEGKIYIPLPGLIHNQKWLPCAITVSPISFLLGPTYYCTALGVRQKVPDVTERRIKVISENTPKEISDPIAHFRPHK